AKSGPLTLSEETLPQIWQEVLSQAGNILAAQLGNAGIPAISGPNALVLRFSATYNSQREYCQEPTRLTRIEELLRRITGRTLQVRVESVGGLPSAEPVEAVDDSAISSSRYRRQRTEAGQEPLLKRAIDVLGAQVVHLDDGFGAAPGPPGSRSEDTDN